MSAARDENHRDRIRRSNRARARAYKRLAVMFPKEYAALLEEEGAKEGVVPYSARARKRIEKIKADYPEVKDA